MSARGAIPVVLATAFLACLVFGLRPGAHVPRAAHLPSAGKSGAERQEMRPRAERTPESFFVRRLTMPIAGLDPKDLRDSFGEARGSERRHEALDIPAPRGTPVLAVDDGVVKKLFTSVPGGLTVYQFDPTATYVYYYAHLDGYAPGLREEQTVKRGDVVGFVGSTGNATTAAPHLHVAVGILDVQKRWWKSTPVDPLPLLAAGAEMRRGV